MILEKPAKGTAANERRARRLVETRERAAKENACVVCGKPRPSSRGWNTRPACPGACEAARVAAKRKRPCASCGALFTPGTREPRKFCSRKCYYAEHNKRLAMVEVACAQCGSAFRRTAAAIKRRARAFCSRACSAIAHRAEGSPLYRGQNDPNRGGGWRRLAETIRDRDNRACRRCGTTEAANGAKLSVDHIRPWRAYGDKAYANDPENLVALCKRCHSFKTLTVERAWLRGDRVELTKWLTALGIDQGPRSVHSGHVRIVAGKLGGDGPVRFVNQTPGKG